MDPITAAGLGMQLYGGVSNLIGGNAARKRAEEARRQLVNQITRQLSDEETAFQANNSRSLEGLTGNLGNALEVQGRSLGAANAGSGVYNSSATAGALANQGAANSQYISSYATDLGSKLAQLRSDNRNYLAKLQFGQANEDLDYARGQQSGGIAGLGNVLQMLPGFINPPKTKAVDGIQSAIQTKTQQAQSRFGVPNPNSLMFAPGQGSGGVGLQMPKLPTLRNINLQKPLALSGFGG